MGKIKSFFSDKGRVGVFIVCLMLLSVALVSSVFKGTYALGASNFTCPIGGVGPTESTSDDYRYYCQIDAVKSGYASDSYPVGTDLTDSTTTGDSTNTICYKYLTEMGYEFAYVSSYGCSYIAKQVSYDVIYDANGGTVSPTSETWSIGESKEIVKPSRSGYTFDGWLVTADAEDYSLNTIVKAGSKYNFSSIVTAYGATEITLIAQWTLDTDTETETEVYTVKYIGNGGSPVPDAEIWTFGVSYAISSTVPEKDGYIFDGWEIVGDDSGRVLSPGDICILYDYRVGSVVTLSAKWTLDTDTETEVYTVKYIGNGGSPVPDAEIWTFGVSYAISSTVPEKDGYTFDGWEIVGDDSGRVLSPGDICILYDYRVGSVVTLSAKWTIDSSGEDTGSEDVGVTTYTVTYNSNGGTGTMSSSTFTSGVAKTLTKNTFTRSGYTFSGWNTNSAGTGTSYTDGQSITVTKNLTLYAQWTKNSSGGDTGSEDEDVTTYTVAYNSNGGTGTMSSSSFTSGVAKKLTKNTFTRSGYTFSGWNTNMYGLGTSYKDEQSITVTKNLTLYAQWTKNSSGEDTGTGDDDTSDDETITYSIKYNSNGGTGTMSNSSHTYGIAKNLTKNTFTRTGYTFSGWNTNMLGFGTSYTDGQSVSNLSSTNGAVVTLYAQWEGNTYGVKYDANGGTGTMSNSSHTYGTRSKLTTNTFTREGYTFNGWNTKKDGTGISYTDGQYVSNLSSTNDDTVTLYAQWLVEKEDGSEDIIYYVKYNANGGTGTMANSEHVYEVYKNLSTNTFVREGYEFNGWNTKKDGSGIGYVDEEAVAKLADSNGAIVTLYAQWVVEEKEDNNDDNTSDGNDDVGNGGNDNNQSDGSGIIEESPKTGSLPIILVSLIGLGSLVTFVVYRKKIRI